MSKYTFLDDYLTFDNVLYPALGIGGGPIGINGDYSISGDTITKKDPKLYVVNAIDINWNGILVLDDKKINTTGDLIKWILDEISNAGVGGCPECVVNPDDFTVKYSLNTPLNNDDVIYLDIKGSLKKLIGGENRQITEKMLTQELRNKINGIGNESGTRPFEEFNYSFNSNDFNVSNENEVNLSDNIVRTTGDLEIEGEKIFNIIKLKNKTSNDILLADGTTISISELQSDWALENSSAVDYIKNKPNPSDLYFNDGITIGTATSNKRIYKDNFGNLYLDSNGDNVVINGGIELVGNEIILDLNTKVIKEPGTAIAEESLTVYSKENLKVLVSGSSENIELLLNNHDMEISTNAFISSSEGIGSEGFIDSNKGFKVNGKDNNYVLLAGGETKLLSLIINENNNISPNDFIFTRDSESIGVTIKGTNLDIINNSTRTISKKMLDTELKNFLGGDTNGIIFNLGTQIKQENGANGLSLIINSEDNLKFLVSGNNNNVELLINNHDEEISTNAYISSEGFIVNGKDSDDILLAGGGTISKSELVTLIKNELENQ